MENEYILPYKDQVVRDGIALLWNLVGQAVAFQEVIPEHDRLIKAPPNRTRHTVLVPCKIDASYKQTMDELFEVETEEIELKTWWWQWHDAFGPWRIFTVRWGFAPKAKTLVYSDPYELPSTSWPADLFYNNLERAGRYYNAYGKFRNEGDQNVYG